MGQRTWFGGIGEFTNIFDWVSPGPLTSGDFLTISHGIVRASEEVISGYHIVLAGPTDNSAPTLVLKNVVLDSDLHVQPYRIGPISNPNDAPAHARMTVAGAMVNNEFMTVGFSPMSNPAQLSGQDLPVVEPLVPPQTSWPPPPPASLNVTVRPGGVMINGGTVNVAQFSTLNIRDVRDAGMFLNNGLVTSYGTTEFDLPVSGNGVFTVRGNVEFGDSVDAGSVVYLDGGHLVLDKPMEFLGTIDHVRSGLNSTIELKGAHVTSFAVDDSKLNLLNGQQLVAELDFSEPISSPTISLSNHDGSAFVALDSYVSVS